MTRRKPLTLNAGKLEQLPDNGAIAGVATVRQTVLNGSVDANGFPNALSIGSGLAVTLTATGTAFCLSFAAGWDSNGAIDYLSQFTANQSFSSLTASTTCFLYVDRDSTTGTLTTGFTTIAPVYATIAPTLPATGQHWFDQNAFTMKRWSGSAWIVCQRVFVGEAVTSASTVTTATTYAHRGFYQSAWVAVTANTIYNWNHNLGIPIASANAAVTLYTSTTASDSDAILGIPALAGTMIFYGYQTRNSATLSPRKTVSLAALDFPALNPSNAWVATGVSYKITVSRGW